MVFESSQTMNDIPFGDHFTVESRWDFSAAPPRADGTAQTKVQCEQAHTVSSCASFGLALQMLAVQGDSRPEWSSREGMQLLAHQRLEMHILWQCEDV